MPQYDENATAKTFKTSFNLLTGNEKPDLRNAKYVNQAENLSCPICQQPYLQPMTTLCGHTFCKECIFECLKVGNNEQCEGFCPMDRTPIDGSNIHDLFPTPLIITNMVDDLYVYCLNYERGCSWTGRRWEVERHLIQDCGYTGIVCNRKRMSEVRVEDEANAGTEIKIHLNRKEHLSDSDSQECTDSELTAFMEEGVDSRTGQHLVEQYAANSPSRNSDIEEYHCSILTERRFIDEETNTCVHEVFPCCYCNTSITKINEKQHLNEFCEHNYITCSLCQNDTIPKKLLEKHESNCLKAGKVLCPANDIGCPWVGTNRPSLEVHIKSCQLHHLLPFLQSQESKISQLTEENQHLQNQIHQILGNIVSGKITNLGYSEPIEEVGTFRRDIMGQNYLHHLNYEVEDLRNEIRTKVTPFIERELKTTSERQSVLNGLLNDNFIMRGDLDLQMSMMNSLRKQLKFYMFQNRSNTPIMNSSIATGNSDTSEMPARALEDRLNLKL